MIEFQHPELDLVLEAAAAEREFQAEGRSLVIRGVCSECNKARAARRRLVM
jgi:Fur family ferric uptake transcriptional regulator